MGFTITIATHTGTTAHTADTLEELFQTAAAERAGTVHVPDDLHYCTPSWVWADEHRDIILDDHGNPVPAKEPDAPDAFGYRYYGENEDTRPEDPTARLLNIYRDAHTTGGGDDLDALEEASADYRVWAHETPLPHTTETLQEYTQWLFGKKSTITVTTTP